MTDFTPQLYDLTGDCNKLLPVGGIVNSLTFQEVTILEQTIDSSEWMLPDEPSSGQIESVYGDLSLAIGIPLSQISPVYEKISKPRLVRAANGVTIVAGNDKIFLPSDTKLITTWNKRKPLPVELRGLKPGNVKIEGKKVEITPRTLEILESHGEAYVRLVQTPGSVLLQAKYEDLILDDAHELLTKKTITYKGKSVDITLTDVATYHLKRGERAFVRLNNGELLRVNFKKPAVVPQPIENLYYSRPSSGIVPDPQHMQLAMLERQLLRIFGGNMCDIVKALHADPRARVYYDASLSSSKPIPPIDNHLFLPLLESFHQKLDWTECLDGTQTPQPKPTDNRRAPQPKLPVYEIGFIATYRQDWELKGYSRGALLSSITLAPREEIQIEVFTWDRHKLEEEQTFSTEYEKNLEFNVLNRGSSEVGRTINEEMGAQAGGHVGGSLPVKKANLEGQISGQVAQQLQTERQLTVGRVSEATTKATERFKASHKVKIVQTHEYGEENRTTRRFSNPNSGRTLTLHHFEILEHYQVTTTIQEPTNPFCLLVENPPLGEAEEFEIDFVLQYEDRLQQALLSPNFKAGFSAARMLTAQRWYEKTTALEEMTSSRVNSGANSEPSEDSSVIPMKGIFATARNLVDTLNIFLDPENDQYIKPLDEVFDNVIEHLTQGTVTMSDMQDVDRALTRHSFWFRMTFTYPGFEASAKKFIEEVKGALAVNSQESKDRIAAAVSLLVGGLDDDWLFTLKSIALPIIFARMLELVNPLYGAVLTTYLYKNVLTPDDMGLSALLSKARKQSKDYDDVQEAETLMPSLPNPFAGDGNNSLNITASPLVPRAPRVYSIKELAEAHADFLKLKLHLKANADYYRNELWRREDPAERYLRLDKEGLTPFIENRLLGFAGNKAMYPLRLAALPQATRDDLLTMAFGDQDVVHEAAEIEAEPVIQQITLPTPGIHMEAILGQCEALEPFLIEIRDIEKQERIIAGLLLQEELAQAQQETERLKLRLQQNPPLLNDPYSDSKDTAIP